MNLRTTRALVSRTMKMSDSSKLATLITERHGLVKVMARGARRPKSKYGAALEPITLVEVIYTFREHRDIQNLSNADIIESYERVKSDLVLFAAASVIIEIAQTQTTVEDPKAGTFALVVETLGDLEHSRTHDAEKHIWRFVLRLLTAAGYRPSLDACALCGGKPRGSAVFFSLQDGGMICSCTAPENRAGFRVSPGSLMVMKALSAGTADEMARLRINKRQRTEIERIVLGFLAYHTGAHRPPRSLAFFRKIEADFHGK